MKKKSLLAILCVVLVFTSCGTLFTQGGSAYREGVSQYKSKEYVKSLGSLQTALIKNPEFLEASAMFPIVFNEGTQYYKSIISENAVKETPDEADMVYDAYLDIQQLHQIAKNSGRTGLNTEDFTTEVKESEIRAIELRFNYAENLEATGDRENIKAAVAHYEIVKRRNPQFPDIDQRIEMAVKKANRTLMVFGISENDDFHNQINAFLQKDLAKDRFVTLVNAKDFQSKSTNKKAAIAWGQQNNIDYMLTVRETKSFKTIRNSEEVLLPSSTPIFKGNKVSHGFSTQYKLDYSLIELNPSAEVVAQDVLQSDYTSPLFTYSYVGQDEMLTKDMSFDNTGIETYRYISSNVDSTTLSNAVWGLKSDYSNVYIPATITDPTSREQWELYYSCIYHSLDSLVKNEGGNELAYGLELVQDSNTGTYYSLGNSPFESIQKAKVVSAMFNSKTRTALNLIESEEDKFYDSFDLDVATQLGNYLKKIF